MLPRIAYLSICSMLLSLSFLLAGCGGGGGGTSSGGGLAYSGLTDPAQITATNAEALAISAFEGGTFTDAGGMTKSQSAASAGFDQANLSGFTISGIMRLTLNVVEGAPRRATAAKAAVGGSTSGDGSCAQGPGSVEYVLTFQEDYTADGVFDYVGFCSRGSRLTGRANINAVYDGQTLMLAELTVSFNLLKVESSTASSIASGSIRDYNILDTSYNETINMFVMDVASSKTFRTEDLETINSAGSGYFDVTVTGGRFYHPDHGYVSMSTASPMRYYDDAESPSSGSFQIAGGSGSTVEITFYPSDFYRVQADTDGNDSCDLDSGVKNWEGTNSPYAPPTANAGADKGTYVGQATTLDGSSSVSQYGEPLAYSWSITSKPARSSTVLMNQNTVSPSFTPDIAGTYIISLKVNDGYSESLADTATVTVSNVPLFSAYQATRTGSWAEAVTIGDVNGDGRNDVALVTGSYFDAQNDKRLHVFLQNTSGSLELAAKHEIVNGRPSSVVSGDLNNDGRADVAVGTDTGITVFLQNGAGAQVFSSFYSTSNSYKLTIGDFNNDGRLDLASVGIGQAIEVRLQDSSGGLSAPATYTVASQSGYRPISSGDVNGDGRMDIVVTYFASFPVRGLAVFLQNSAGTFNSEYYPMTSSLYYATGLAVGDVNGDSRKDMVFTYGGNGDTAKLGVFLQTAQSGMESQSSYQAYDIPEPVVIADVNNDGRDDILVAHGGWNALTVYLQESNAQLGSYQKYALPYASHYNPQGLAVGDINNDGKKDVVIADYNNGLVVLYNIY